MKSTGIIREMDELGRIVIPKELRRTLSMEKGSHIEIFTDKDMICLKGGQRLCLLRQRERAPHQLHGQIRVRRLRQEPQLRQIVFPTAQNGIW